MKPGLLFLPFLGLIIGSVGTSVGNAAAVTWVMPAAWAVAGVFFLLWIILDLENISRVIGRKGAKYGASSGLAILLAGAFITGIAYVSTKPRFNKNWDVTKGGANTLSDQSEKIIEKMKKDKATIEVKAFFADENSKQAFVHLIELYQIKGAAFNIKYLNTAIDIEDAKSEKLTNPNTVIFRQGPQESRLTVFNEEKVTNALLNVLKTKKKKILFTEGHGEGKLDAQDEVGFNIVKTELETNNFDVQQVTLLAALEEVKTADLIIVAGPAYDLTEPEVKILDDYLTSGGSVMLLVNALVPAKNMNLLAEKYGMSLGSDILLLHPNSPQAQMYGKNFGIINTFSADHDISRDFSKASDVAILLPSSRSVSRKELEDKNIQIVEIAKTHTPLTIRVKDIFRPEDLKGDVSKKIDTAQHSMLTIASRIDDAPKPADDDAPSPEPTKTKGFRFLVGGSAAIAANLGAQDAATRDLFVNSVNYLVRDEDFIAIRPKPTDKSTIDVTSSSSQVSLFVLAFIYPFIFLCSGAIYWLQRRKS